MKGHQKGTTNGQELCDQLLAEVQRTHPTAEREHLSVSCSFRVPPNNRFAYVYHTATNQGVSIYLRGDADETLDRWPRELELAKRKRLEGNWALEFPLSMKVRSPKDVAEAVRALLELSYPRAQRKSARNGRISASKVRSTIPEEVGKGRFSEGNVARILVNRYERDPRARAECIRRHGCLCMVCGFDFGRTYGERMNGFTHVHHLRTLASLGPGYEVDPISDLIPVCPNCHAVMHSENPPLTVAKVKELLAAQSPTNSS